MDEGMLNDLLECSVCLERLDTSSKVLPCQHTFCKKCLEEIIQTQKELRCPECRVLVEIKVDELPPNVLLMRILEGMRSAAPKKQRSTPKNNHSPAAVPTVNHATLVQQHAPGTPDRRHVISKQISPPSVQPTHHQPYARAVYDYLSKVHGDLNFKRGEIIILRKRIDSNWYQGECGGKQGVFPLSYVQIITPLPSHIPQCKALYDFRMTNDDEEGCLTFNKGEIITVIRRVDENWAEGKLEDRIGIFPLAFVELNSLARSLMKLSTNSQPGPSRLAPPTPTTEDSAPLIPTDHTRTVSSIAVSQPSTVSASVAGGLLGSDSSSTVSSGSSSTTPNTSSSNTSSSSSTAPSSPASPPPRGQAAVARGQNSTGGSARAVPTVAVASPPPRTTHSSNNQNREKRHSFSALNTSHQQQGTNRHSAEILGVEDQPSSGHHEKHRRGNTVEHGASNCQMPTLGHKSSGSIQLPAAYIALYPYKPQKVDELELRKGGIYMVTERCQDGWFKGTSNRSQKCGVFPGNYVKLARGMPSLQSGSGDNSGELKVAMSYTRSGKPGSVSGMSPKQEQKAASISLQPPELPPRSGSPASTNNVISTSWHDQAEGSNAAAPLGRSHSAVMNSVVSSPPNACVSSPNVGRSSVDTLKDRKERNTTSFMKLWTSKKRSKSPPPTAYSRDDSSFEEASILSTTSSMLQPVHVRSGSCPSQLLQVQPAADGNASHLRLFASTSQRLKHKERPSVMAYLAHTNARNSEHIHGTAAGGATSSPTVTHHRKSNSLDAGSKTKTPQQTVRERFRCIVPYPPNSEYELELQINDIIYVHKKRDDGWYKGTQQRTGRTGLFPASFVENF